MAALAEDPRNKVSSLCNSCYTRVSPALLSCPSPASSHSPGSFSPLKTLERGGWGLETRSPTADLEQQSFASCIVLTRNPAHTRGIQTLSGTERNGVPLSPSRNTAAKIPRGNFSQAQPLPSFQKDFHKPVFNKKCYYSQRRLPLSRWDGLVRVVGKCVIRIRIQWKFFHSQLTFHTNHGARQRSKTFVLAVRYFLCQVNYANNC